MSWIRLLLAFLGAPLVPAVVQATIGESQYHPLAVFVVAMAIIYVLQLVVGIPGYLLLHRSGRHALPPYALFGFCVGLCAGAALVPISESCQRDEQCWHAVRPSRRSDRRRVGTT